jgi:hypothetical protein
VAGTQCQSHSVTGRDWSVADRLVRVGQTKYDGAVTAAPWPRRRAARAMAAAVNRGAEPADSARWGSKLSGVSGLSRPARTRGGAARFSGLN